MRVEDLRGIFEKQFYPHLEFLKKEREIRKLVKDSSLYAERYYTEPHTPELIEDMNKAFWKQAGFGDFDFRCNVTSEEIMSIEGMGRMVILIHPEIIEPEGLVKLANAFPWTRDSCIADIDKAKRIKHNSSYAGYADVDANYNTTIYDMSKFEKEITLHDRVPQRLTTYISATLFSLLYRGHPLDNNNTSSVLLGSSFYDGKENKTIIATWNESEKRIDISLTKVSEYFPDWGVRTERVLKKTGSHLLASSHVRHKAVV